MPSAPARYRGIITPGSWARWIVVVALALLVSGVEALGAVLVFALLGLATDPDGAIDLPIVGDLRELAPGLSSEELIVATAAAVALFFVIRGVVVLAQTYTQVRVANTTGVELSTRLLDRYLRLPYAFHLRRNSSELIRNANDSVSEILDSILMPTVRLVAEGAVVIGLVAVLLLTAPGATLIAAAVLVPLVTIIVRLVQPRIGRLGEISQVETGRSIQALQQSLHGYRDITVLGRQQFFLDTYRTSREHIARARSLTAVLGGLPRVTIEAFVIGLVAIFMVVSTLAGDGPQGSLAIVGLFAYASLRIMPSLNKVVGSLNTIRYGRAALDDVQDDLRRAVPELPSSTRRLPFTDRLRLEHVTFHYPGLDTPILDDVDLAILRGQSVGIVGSTGAGKSTLVDLLMGLSVPTSGRIVVDGVDLRGNEPAWQRNLGMVSQQVFLLDDTLRRNIALGIPDEEIDEGQVHRALQLAQLGVFLESLPDGLDTWVGEQGVRVSGGQRQRLAIARALYTEPDVLVFDEATSALDNVTEASLIAALAELRHDHTLITVAHRLSTVQDYDVIVHLHQGRILDVGTYDDLLARSTEFRHLARVAGAHR